MTRRARAHSVRYVRCGAAGRRPQVSARVGFGDDLIDALLVEAFEAGVALEVFQVRADGAGGAELLGLLGCDLPHLQQALDAIAAHRPVLAFGEGLAEVRKVGEGLHHPHALVASELLSKGIEIELAFEMEHAGVEDGLAVQCAPEADGAEVWAIGQRLVGRIDEHFFGGEVDIGKDDDTGVGLLHDLRVPSGLPAGVETFAAAQAEFLEDGEPVVLGEDDAREDAAEVVETDSPGIGGLPLETSACEFVDDRVVLREREMIDPVDEAGAGLAAHALREGGRGEAVLRKTEGEVGNDFCGGRLGPPEECFEGVWGGAHAGFTSAGRWPMMIIGLI